MGPKAASYCAGTDYSLSRRGPSLAFQGEPPGFRSARTTRNTASELNGDRLHFRILLQAVFAQLTPNAGLLEASKRRRGIENVVAVHPDRARPNGIGDGVR